MTQNVDLQVKVKFIVDPKDLQAALSGGGAQSKGAGGSGGGGPPGSAPASPQSIANAQLAAARLQQVTARTAQQAMLAAARLHQLTAKTAQQQQAAASQAQLAAARLQHATARTAQQQQAAASQAQLAAARLQQVTARTAQQQQAAASQAQLTAAKIQLTNAQTAQRTQQTAAQAQLAAAKLQLTTAQTAQRTQQTVAQSQLAAVKLQLAQGQLALQGTQQQMAAIRLQRLQQQPPPRPPAQKVGKGYGSEGMFAAGTSPIMQGLAWQSLFATGDILGPMSFAPMALYQNYSLKRQRRNRGFDLGAGSDLANAAGVGPTGQIATAGHALAAIRNNAALSPAEREKRMAQVDIMSAGRVRGRLGRGIEMFEAGQLGGKGMQTAGLAVAALGGVSSVALGVVAGLGAVAMSLKVFDDRMKASVESIRAGTAANDEQRRSSRRGLQEQMEKGLAGDLGADLAALESAGISPDLTPGMRGLAARAVRSSGGDAAKRLMATAEKAAKTYNMTPESAMEALLQARAGRLPADALDRRAPNIFAKEVGATAGRRVQMREAWTAGAPATGYGAFAEEYRGDVGYAEGRNFERFFSNQERVRNRIAEIKSKIKQNEEMRSKGLLSYNPDELFTLPLELKALKTETNITRSLAKDPLAIENAMNFRKQIEAVNKFSEKISGQNGFITFISTMTDVMSLGVWESLTAEKLRKIKEFEEENRRKQVATGAP